MAGNTDFNDQQVGLGRESLRAHLDYSLAEVLSSEKAKTALPPKALQGVKGDIPVNTEQFGGGFLTDEPPDNGSWVDRFEVGRDGRKGSVFNTQLVLSNDRVWRGVLGYCLFSYRIIKKKTPPLSFCVAGEWEDSDTASLRVWLATKYKFTPSHTEVADALVVVAKANQFHPVRDYLNGVEWDGVCRLSSWLKRALGATDKEEYLSVVGLRFLVGAVARVMRPGCKMDTVLILEGLQGVGKSTVVSVLFGDWFTDAPIPIGDKDAFQVIQGKWCLELAELDSFNKSETTTLKQFFSMPVDRFRPSYGRVALDHPRQTVFMGTTNQEAYLRDYTGNRRFWPVFCSDVSVEWVRALRDQLWAEAVALYRAGEQWWATSEETLVVEDAQDARLQRDPWEELLRPWLAEREHKPLTTAEVLTEGLRFDAPHIQQAHMNRLGPIIKALGWKSKRLRLPDSGGKPRQRRVWVSDAYKSECDSVPFA